MFRVVTIAGEYGSGAGVIARKIAERLRWNLLDRTLIVAVARTAGVSVETVERYDERSIRGGIGSIWVVCGQPRWSPV